MPIPYYHPIFHIQSIYQFHYPFKYPKLHIGTRKYVTELWGICAMIGLISCFCYELLDMKFEIFGHFLWSKGPFKIILEAKILHEKISAKAYNHEDLIRIWAASSKAQINASLNHYKNKFWNDINKVCNWALYDFRKISCILFSFLPRIHGTLAWNGLCFSWESRGTLIDA